MSILIFLAVLFVLILVHEWGHYITAKWTKMRVDEFAIGFPPRLFSWRRGETEYSLNALPIGGYVKILGENGDEDEVLSDTDKPRTFGARPKWAQALVLVAGVTMNVLLAFVLLFAILLVGTPTQVDESTATDAAVLRVLETVPGSPASVIPTQSEIVSVARDGMVLSDLTPSNLAAFVAENQSAAIDISYIPVGGVVASVTLTPATGLVPGDTEKAILGLSSGLIEVRSYGFVPALKEAAIQTVSMLGAITTGLFTLLGNAITGTADFSQVAGPVGIVEHVGTAASFGFTSLLFFTAVISLNLAVINLLPVPALDGGRLVFVAIEALTRRTIPHVWAGRLNLVGFALLMLLMVVVTYNDILKLL
jgi:regulator of sigma E protease